MQKSIPATPQEKSLLTRVLEWDNWLWLPRHGRLTAAISPQLTWCGHLVMATSLWSSCFHHLTTANPVRPSCHGYLTMVILLQPSCHGQLAAEQFAAANSPWRQLAMGQFHNSTRQMLFTTVSSALFPLTKIGVVLWRVGLDLPPVSLTFSVPAPRLLLVIHFLSSLSSRDHLGDLGEAKTDARIPFSPNQHRLKTLCPMKMGALCSSSGHTGLGSLMGNVLWPVEVLMCCRVRLSSLRIAS